MNIFVTMLFILSCQQTKSVLKLTSNESIKENSFEIKLLKLEDSRCPEGMKCFTEGSAKITLQLISKNDSSILSIDSASKKPLVIENKKLFITDVSPYPKAGETLKLSDYRITFKSE